MIRSMTGFATARGEAAPYSWMWEVRSVNGKGLDMRLRVPDWVQGLEAGLRTQISATCARGNITCNLRLTREEGQATLAVNEAQLASVLEALQQIEQQAMNEGLSLAPSKATDIASMRGILETAAAEAEDTAALNAMLQEDFKTILADFNAMRASEGAALAGVLADQLAQVERLTGEAAEIAKTRSDEMAQTMRRNLQKVIDNTDGLDEARVLQEIALIGVKADITEEIDRLHAHIGAARDLLAQDGAVGRKLDFLMQEFNREANTLCSKAQHSGLTKVGLALKALIDQMREQVQNVE